MPDVIVEHERIVQDRPKAIVLAVFQLLIVLLEVVRELFQWDAPLLVRRIGCFALSFGKSTTLNNSRMLIRSRTS